MHTNAYASSYNVAYLSDVFQLVQKSYAIVMLLYCPVCHASVSFFTYSIK